MFECIGDGLVVVIVEDLYWVDVSFVGVLGCLIIFFYLCLVVVLFYCIDEIM